MDSAVFDSISGAVPPVPPWSSSGPGLLHEVEVESKFAGDATADDAAAAAAQHDAAFAAAAARSRVLPSLEHSETPSIDDASRRSFRGCTSHPLHGSSPTGLCLRP